jgi:hypothetical protein
VKESKGLCQKKADQYCFLGFGTIVSGIGINMVQLFVGVALVLGDKIVF